MENNIAKLGDVLIVNNGLMKLRVIENILNDDQEKEYILVNLHDFTAVLWSKDLRFELGQTIFTDDFKITGIVQKEKIQESIIF